MYIIGIDGGGTKTKGYISDLNGNILASAKDSTSNYLSAGILKTKESLGKVITSLCDEINIDNKEIEIISLGLAGVGREKDKEIIKKIVRELGIKGQIIINSDAYIALVGAHGKSQGVITISGTGSISLGTKNNGETYRTGGWGHILGDEGSGYYFGREGLVAIMKSYDGRGKPTLIEDRMMQCLNFTSIDELLYYVYSNEGEKHKISCLSGLVIEAAEKKDQVAQDIVDKGVWELVNMTMILIDKMEENMDIALAGGIFENSDFIREKFIKKLSVVNSQCRVIDNKFNSGIGALLIGWDYKEIKYDESKILKQIKEAENNE